MNLSPLTPRLRGKYTLTMLATVLLLAGCTRKSPAEKIVDAAVKRYAAVATGMTKQDLLAKLGEPAKREGDRWRWEAVASPQNHVAIEVRFDGADRIVSIARTRATAD
jgi:outer membrane protein assembly factor BamE (lipoprotein component of BamABCDE complex)